ATVAGYQFPVMFALLGEGRRGVSQQVGFAYGFNTAGSIVGALASGFILIPKVGALTSWRLMSGVFVLMALWLTVVICRRRGIRALLEMRASLAACVLGVLCLLSRGPTAATRHSPIGAGRTHLAGKDGNQLEYWRRTAALHVVWEKDGVESTVGIETSHGVSFLVNGKSDGSVFLDRGTQGMSTMLPALLHQNPKSVFVLGLGTGMSAGWVAAIPGVERVDVAELEPAVLEVARRAAAANQGVLKRPNVHLFVGDGREFLLTTNRQYDVISSEPSNPYRAGIASLFTREFYQAVSQHLKAGGLFSQWLQTYEVDVLTLRIALSTIISVFPVVELWQTQSGDLLLLCSREPRVYDIASLRKRAAQEPFRSALRRTWFAEDAEGVLGRFLARDKLTRALAQTFEMPLNTDDNTVLEYAFARHVGSHGGDTTADILDLSVQAGTQRPAVRGEVDWKRVAEARARSWMVSRDEMPRLPELDRDAQARVDVVAAACSGSKAPSFRSLQQQAQTARDVLEWYAMGEGFAHLGDAQALVLADKLATQSHRVEAELIRGRYHAANHRPAEAFDALLRGVGELRRDALPLCSAALQTLELMRNVAKGNPALERRAIQALLSGHFAADLEDELRVRTAQELAFSLGDPEVCVRALGRQLSEPWWEQTFLTGRYQCLERAHHPQTARALEELTEYLEEGRGNIAAGVLNTIKPGPPPAAASVTSAIGDTPDPP
ncbi:MAG TPA: fused MFS/spermidine synthase, partial [Polyangiaceae bacterium]